MFIALQRIAGAKHDDGGVHIPLQLKPGVGAYVEAVAHHGVDGTDQDGEQHKPVADLADILIDPVDKATERQEWRHEAYTPCLNLCPAREAGFFTDW